MKKKIAILIRDRQHEALRMAVGATLANDEVNVFILNNILEADEEIDNNIQMLTDLKAKVFSNTPENMVEQKSIEDIARMLPEYDVVIPY